MRFGVILAVVAVAALVLTNPSREDYAAWAKFELTRKGGLEGLVGGLVPASLIGESTRRTNFVLFSLFDTQVLGATEIRTIGVMSSFFTLRPSDQAPPPAAGR